MGLLFTHPPVPFPVTPSMSHSPRLPQPAALASARRLLLGCVRRGTGTKDKGCPAQGPRTQGPTRLPTDCLYWGAPQARGKPPWVSLVLGDLSSHALPIWGQAVSRETPA